MVEATWKSVEARGIPNSPVRRMLFELAERIGHHATNGDDLALMSAAYRALMDVLHERARDDSKPPLQIQVDVQRDVREIRAMGVDVLTSLSRTRTSASHPRRQESSPRSSAMRTKLELYVGSCGAGFPTMNGTAAGSR